MSQKASSAKTAKKGKRSTKTTEPTEREVTFTFRAPISNNISEEDFEHFKMHGEIYARLLESDETPQVFKDVFRAVFVDDLYNASQVADITDPAMVRILWPLIMAHGSACKASEYFEGIDTAMMTLRGELCGTAQVEKILAAVAAERKGVRADG